jgi:hypothetical protein
MFVQTKEVELTLLLGGTCNIGSSLLAATVYYECRDVLVRDKQITVSLYAGTNKDSLSYYKSYLFDLPSDGQVSMDIAEDLVRSLDEYSTATVV